MVDRDALELIRERLPDMLRDPKKMESIAGSIEGGFVSDLDVERIFYLFDRLGAVSLQEPKEPTEENHANEAEACSKFVLLRKELIMDPPASLGSLIETIIKFMKETGYKMPRIIEQDMDEEIAQKKYDESEGSDFDVYIDDKQYSIAIRMGKYKDIIVYGKTHNGKLFPVAY